MKKIYSFVFILLILSSYAQATIVNIDVSNYQFSPNNVNVTVGDVIHFTFVAGFHNATTNGVPGGLPSGATALYSGNPGTATTYDFTVTVAGTYKYVCEVHGDAATFTGMVAQFTASSGTIPVVLKQFNVAATGTKKPLLSWSTATEINTAYFSVRRSNDNIHFTEITRVNARGNSSSEQSYGFTDNTLNAANTFVYYELAIVDKNGNEKLSDIKLFRNALSGFKLINHLSPNPITRPGQLMVYFNAEKASMMKVEVFDAQGKQVFDTNMDAVQGLNSGHIHVCNFNTGIYTLIFTMDGITETKRIVVN